MFIENPNGSKDKLLSEFSKAADTTSIYKNQFICQIKQKMKILKIFIIALKFVIHINF